VRVNIPSLDGSTALRVPPGTAAGVKLRLRGLGLPREGGVRGDLFATVRICTPAPVSDDERALWEQLAKVSTFKPRSEI
jgi:curved DNA-binding protein